MTPLEILEEGHKEAEAALAALKEQWKADDAALKAERAAILEAHAQGARDRDAVRTAMGGTSLIDAADKKVADAAAERARLASLPTAPRASSLPVQPLAALGQMDKADDKPATKAT
jgi:hypothetical protein